MVRTVFNGELWDQIQAILKAKAAIAGKMIVPGWKRFCGSCKPVRHGAMFPKKFAATKASEPMSKRC